MRLTIFQETFWSKIKHDEPVILGLPLIRDEARIKMMEVRKTTAQNAVLHLIIARNSPAFLELRPSTGRTALLSHDIRPSLLVLRYFLHFVSQATTDDM